MASEWSSMRLEDCMDAIIDYRGKTPKKTVSGVPLVTAKIIKNGRILPPQEFIANEDYEAWMRRGIPKPGDIVMTTEAPLGEIAELGSEKVALAQRVITLRGKKGLLDNRFLKYLMISQPVQAAIRARASGTTVTGIKQRELRKVELSFPPLPTQRRIAHILGSLDDKIELNRRMNRTLENMAQALFKSWFVDFDPVHAKAEGRDPNLSKHLADLFPATFQNSELGQIPTGWDATTLKDVIKIYDNKRIPLNKRQRSARQGVYPYYGAASIMDYVDDYLFDGVYVLAGEDGSVVDDHGHPVLQYVWGQFWVNNHAHILQGKNGISTEHLYLLLKQAEIRPFVTGAVQPKLNQKNLKSVPMILSTESVCQAFSEIIQPLFAKIRANIDQYRMLTKFRDILLPRLISGELDVSNLITGGANDGE